MVRGEEFSGIYEIDPVLGKRRLPLRLVPLESRGILVHRSIHAIVNTFSIYNPGHSAQPLGLRPPNA